MMLQGTVKKDKRQTFSLDFVHSDIEFKSGLFFYNSFLKSMDYFIIIKQLNKHMSKIVSNGAS